LDAQQVQDLNAPITAAYDGLDLCSSLTLAFAPHGLACDYRYGCIWITTPADARNWRDTTGVAQLHPPDGSALGGEWDRVLPLDVEAADLPLNAVLIRCKAAALR
jgi:hypothetical protein